MADTSCQTLAAALRSARTLIESRFSRIQAQLSEDCPALPLAFSTSVAAVPLCDWLLGQDVWPRTYWSARDGSRELAGSGAALSIEAESPQEIPAAYVRLEKVLRAAGNESIRFLGGQAFTPAWQGDVHWSVYRSLRYVVPEVLLDRDGQGFTATVAVKVDVATSLDTVLARVAQLLSRCSVHSPPVRAARVAPCLSREDAPDREGWADNVHRSLAAIDRGEVGKIVLARRSTFTLSAASEPIALLSALMVENPNCYGFMLEPAPGSAFLGVTPERLFRILPGRIESEAVSGTAVNPAAEDRRAAAAALLASEKNLREHEFVREHVAARLATVCSGEVVLSTRAPLELSNVLHIHSRLSGVLRTDATLADLVGHLHPTPAVCGSPIGQASRLIAELEPFARGWYAGLNGFIGLGCCEMVVAIRSALVRDNEVLLYAGAGIVQGSDARQEWQELELKIAPALRVLRNGS